MALLSVVASPPTIVNGPIGNATTYVAKGSGINYVNPIASSAQLSPFGPYLVVSSYRLSGTQMPPAFIPKHLQLTSGGWKPVS